MSDHFGTLCIKGLTPMGAAPMSLLSNLQYFNITSKLINSKSVNTSWLIDLCSFSLNAIDCSLQTHQKKHFADDENLPKFSVQKNHDVSNLLINL